VHNLIELGPDAFFLADLTGRYVEVNHAACRMLGYAREELVGKRIVDLIHVEDQSRLAAEKAVMSRPGHAVTSEWTLRKKDGDFLPVEVSANILADGRWQAFVRDISERKRHEDEHRVFESLIENSSDFIGIADPAGKPIYLNPAGRRMVGLPAGHPVEQTQIPEYYPPEERKFATEVILKSMVERGRWSGETSFRHWQTGEPIPVSDDHFMIRDPRDGRILGMGTVTRDISARKRREKEQRFLSEAGAVLASSLDYEQTLVNVGQLVVRDLADWCIIDLVEREGRLVRLKVVSADPSQAAVATQLEQTPIDRSQPYLARPAIESKRPFVIEHITPRELDSLGQSAEHLQLLRTVDPKSMMGLPLVVRGQLLGALVLISSTTSRVYGQDDVQLGEALAERAALAIENGELYRAAMQATRLRDDVLRVVAHDLRNPLSIVVLQSSALRRRAPEPERRDERPIDDIHRAAIRMKRLIEDLLDATLIEARQLALKRARLSTHQLLLHTLVAQNALAASASLELRIDVDGELPDICGDEHRLLQVFENLIGNAIRFTPPGGRITVAATTCERDVLLRVTDTGSGIPPSGLPHVFDRFWQARKDARQGAGLGLPIARGIVEAHGGRIWVESALGSGTSFFFTIPRADHGA
jgi:PAS domain S-box-containing protein